ncbi:MAG: Ig-like domain-containing protein [Clostridiales bacterium]|nr:Ig-like domain-containing protein [Clostridiales bacterium]
MSELVSDRLSEFTWTDTNLNIDVNISIYSRVEGVSKVILYVTNHSNERIGQEADSDIINDFLDNGYHVVVADYLGNPLAVSPLMDHGVFDLRLKIEDNSFFKDLGIFTELYGLYIVPGGYRLLRDAVYWEIDKHGSYGTKEYVMSLWNDYIVKNFNKSPVSSPDEMTKPDGSPIDWQLKMDIFYPSQPNKNTPVMMFQASNSPRNRVESRDKRYHSIGFLLQGYTYVLYDHNYQPLARGDHYGYWDKYTLDDYNGLKSNTAAVRFVRKTAEELGFSADRIGVWGHSKASYGPALLANPNHNQRGEWSTFKGFPQGSPEPQPWQGYSSVIQASYQSMGNGTRRHDKLVTDDNVPTLIACGDKDDYGAWKYWPELKANYENRGLAHLALGMLGLGHTYPFGYDIDLQIDRYNICFDFFNSYLKPETKPALLYVIPPHGREKVSIESTVHIKFARYMNPQSAQTHIYLIDESGQIIEGNLEAIQQNTTFVFTPAQPLLKDHTYTLCIDKEITDTNGIDLGSDRTFGFKTEDDSINIVASADAHISYGNISGSSADSNLGSDATLAIRWWSQGGANGREWNRKAYIKFDFDYISEVINATLNITTAAQATGSTIYIYGLKDEYTNWQEDSITWNNAPGNDTNGGSVLTDCVFNGAPIASFVNYELKKYTIDVTHYIRSLTNNTATFIFIRERSSAGNDYIVSKEAAQTSGNLDMAPHLNLKMETGKIALNADYTGNISIDGDKIIAPKGATVNDLFSALNVDNGHGFITIYKNILKTTQISDPEAELEKGMIITSSSSKGGKTFDYILSLSSIIDIPEATNLVYNGIEQVLVLPGTNIYYTVTGNKATNAGNYTATLTLINDDYVWSDGTNTPKVINWTIEKALINLDNISFENGTFIYNGKEKNLYIGGALPKGVRVEYDNNGQIQPGVYTITARFIIIDTDNYTFEGELPELTAILTIKPTEKKSGCSSSLNSMAIIISWLSLMAILSIKKF